MECSKGWAALNIPDPVEAAFYVVNAYLAWLECNNSNLFVFWDVDFIDALLVGPLQREWSEQSGWVFTELENSDCAFVITN